MSKRVIITGLVGALLISTTSLYIAMRLGALPWPTIFAVLLSRAVLRAWGSNDQEEVNLSHTMMSAGAMIAGGLAFTLPALWILVDNPSISYLQMVALLASGVLLGQAIAPAVRHASLAKLPFPIGKAAYDSLVATFEGTASNANTAQEKSLALPLFGSMGVVGLFTLARDFFAWIPALIGSYIWASPMAMAIGYIIGGLFCAIWFVGSIAAYVIMPLLGWGEAIRISIGIGLMVGTGLAMIVQLLIDLFRKRSTAPEPAQDLAVMGLPRMVPIGCVLSASVLMYLLGLPLVAIAILVIGALSMPFISALLTGRSGINPMEILGVMVMLVVSALVYANARSVTGAAVGTTIKSATRGLSPMLALVMVASVSAISCGLAGDMLNDYYVGARLSVEPKKQWLAEGLGAGVSILVLPAVFLLMIRQFGPVGGALLPVPQAHVVATLLGGIPHSLAFWLAIAFAMLCYLAGLPMLTLGLGVYLPLPISLSICIGGALSCFRKDRRMAAIASGAIGGEAACGVLIALAMMLLGR